MIGTAGRRIITSNLVRSADHSQAGAVRIHRELMRERRVTGLSFWGRGYCVSTVGMDEATIRRYIREQDRLESGQGDLDLK